MEEELSSFMESGVYRLSGLNAIFIEPVRVLNASYTRFRVSTSMYYRRSFKSDQTGSVARVRVSPDPKEGKNNNKKKKRKRGSHILNEREKSAENRHLEVKSLLMRAHEACIGSSEVLSFLRELKGEVEKGLGAVYVDDENSLIKVGNVWQAPLYEMLLRFRVDETDEEGEGRRVVLNGEGARVTAFNNLICNETSDDAEAEFLDRWYLLPKNCCFQMSDLAQIYNLIPDHSDLGFNLIVIDPPWENGSARQKAMYPQLPNRYFLSLPVKQLAHTEGALVALWVTNKEKVLAFVEKELFPAWGITHVTNFYWLKVKFDGSLIGELDLFHHRPYERLLLGYINVKGMDSGPHLAFKPPQANQVIVSVPGDYSRKPPVGNLLLDHAPGPKPVKCIELFARELVAGWTSWGNEPLHFQELRYFMHKNA
ncbi:Methyltransferase-like protein 2 [Acorus gramineus]|uniref:Methyltransferase-like protein 2 n=1 Tax=Acorus gramineus TaxID=55184 RepID=A0AAV9AWT6_ACOGR|nr:Methyltransferase-like protein 2 [Acorus gramineus]